MNQQKKISSALISVYHKEGLDVIINRLHALGVTLYATGGTQQFIEKLNIPVVPVENITDYPSILGGRVKTLHPKIFGGILGRRQNEQDGTEMLEYEIPPIDLVIVDLYPFEETVAADKSEEEIIEKIDIGGISLIRAAAKNFIDVLIIPSSGEYAFLSRILEEKEGVSSMDDRRLMAACAFNVSSHYDTAIFQYFNERERLPVFKKSILQSKTLRYGENPHQHAVYYGNLDKMFEQVHGKEISYNNLLDIDAGMSMINEFEEPTIVIIKHNNACGLSSAPTIEEAWLKALAADPVSAFGGVIVSNRKIEKELAEEIHKIFFEVLIAPAFATEASGVLKQKKNRILLIQRNSDLPEKQFRTILNGLVEQERDTHTEKASDMKIVTLVEPTENQYADLEFANKVVKHLKSNTIVIAKNKQLLGSGTGQTSRVDALRQAIAKATSFGFDLNGSVMASDAFFPFPDCVEIAGDAGVVAIIQPGGSIKDGESIDYCNCHKLAMVTTGYRHFKH